MRCFIPYFFTFALIVLQSTLPAQEKGSPPQKEVAKEQQPDTSGDERILREAKQNADPAALLEYFRKRTYTEVDPQKLTQLVIQLGDKVFRVREKAFDELLTLGARALAAVRQAVRDSKDEEVQHRAQELCQRIEDSANPSVQAAAARLLAAHKTAGAADVFLNYLPFAADTNVIDEIYKAISAVTVVGGKVDPIVVKSLADKLAVKRGAAGVALANAGIAEHLPSVRKLLSDSDPTVRLRVALSLAHRREKEALPKLIDALAHLNPHQVWQAEDILIRLAGEKAPQVSLGTDDAGRQKCHAAWLAWWKDNEKTVDLAKIDFSNTMLGFTLIVQRTLNKIVKGKRIQMEIVELDHNKKERWKIELINYAYHGEVIGNDRVLLCESPNKVTERDFKGEIKWEKQLAGGSNPMFAQRLSNGNTFVMMPNRLVELDKNGNEAYALQRQQFDIFRARKLRNGDIVFITNTGRVSFIDPKTNKELRGFQVPNIGVQFGNIEVLNNGNLLVPNYSSNQVVEYDPTGKAVWQINTPWPNSVQRLPNGNTLVSSFNASRVVELDRNGQEVWNYAAGGNVYTSRRR